jgi:hypothetical protein
MKNGAGFTTAGNATAIRTSGSLQSRALQLAQGPHFIADNGMGGRRALLGPPYVQDGVGEVDLIPTQIYKLGRPQAVAEGDKDHGGIPVTPVIGLGGIDQPIDLGAGRVLPRSIDRVRFSSRHEVILSWFSVPRRRTVKTCRSPYSGALRPASAQQEHPFIRDAICCNELV